MNRLQMPARRVPASGETDIGDKRIIRRFFRLIEQLERPFRAVNVAPAPETKARITRLDKAISRNP